MASSRYVDTHVRIHAADRLNVSVTHVALRSRRRRRHCHGRVETNRRQINPSIIMRQHASCRRGCHVLVGLSADLPTGCWNRIYETEKMTPSATRKLMLKKIGDFRTSQVLLSVWSASCRIIYPPHPGVVMQRLLPITSLAQDMDGTLLKKIRKNGLMHKIHVNWSSECIRRPEVSHSLSTKYCRRRALD